MMRNLLDEIGNDTQLKRVTTKGELAGPCPFCREGKDRFRVWPDEGDGRYWCRRCGKSGDRIAYLVDMGRISLKEAYEMRHKDKTIKRRRR
jgi:DNA primase